MNFAVVTPPVELFPHALAFREIAMTVHCGLQQLGHQSVQTNVPLYDHRNIIIGLHCFEKYDAGIPKGSIVYQMEQYDWTFPNLESLKSYEVWDFSETNVRRLENIGIKAKHVPIGYVPELTYIQLAETRDIDVLFYGCRSVRRTAVLDAISNAGINVVTLEAAYDQRDEHIARSKIVLNMHYADIPGIFEVVRVSHLLANRACVISETGFDQESFEGGLFFASYSKLAETCIEAIKHYWSLEWAKVVGDTGFEAMKRFDEVEILKEALRTGI